MGSLIIQNILSNDDMELVAAFDIVDVGSGFGRIPKERLDPPLEDRSIVGDVSVSDPIQMDDILDQKRPDVLVDFTTSDAAVKNIKTAIHHRINIVVGTTGFTDEQKDEIKRIVDKKVAAVISPNFSVGVNVFWRLLDGANKYLKDYDVEILDIHHRYKKDAPSGTAIRASEILGGREMHSMRIGDIVGDHMVIFAGEGERVEIIHRAHSRQAFVSGVMKAIRWVINAENGLYSMDDVL
jgi:4-hydroxy-tetrahydrodipicolinate reductase